MELILSQQLSQKTEPTSFYTEEEQALLYKLEHGLLETHSHDQVMENLRKKLGLEEK